MIVYNDSHHIAAIEFHYQYILKVQNPVSPVCMSGLDIDLEGLFYDVATTFMSIVIG